MIHPLYGGELLVDFTGLRPRGLALAFARSLFMLAAPRGPIMVRSSLKTYANQLPSFFSYLAGTGDGINGPADLRAHHIDGFETWLSAQGRSEEHTSELQSLMRISYAVFCLKKKKTTKTT